MRSIIISQIENTLIKIAWIEECQGGIYLGFYGKANKMHISYHQDGTVHIKHGSKYLPMYKTIPINEVKTFINLTSYGITIEEGYQFAFSNYQKFKNTNAVIYINPDIIKRKKILNLDPYIIHKNSEKECLHTCSEEIPKA